jgi:hypothetical protein
MKGGRFYYFLAVLVFAIGSLDFTAFIMQKYETFSQGLSDSFALTELGLWWLFSLLIAGVAMLRKRKAGQESSGEPAGQE